ncbi:enoyl-CoA hydratase/isomerase family protein [Nocardioides carbamazepini]|uniref:enoyl-CoA hydratase-related protein n=1 Tax=Nocardioides carbamazepini TaxID=2854259 RepID=UPI0021499F30|nr:enoyl-CoA hydratase-related protein [Nocardioides carbamazepini]MCR1781308.1 enoyl-CoA hydratase/isomerase family protein [Nocardioides carbamazepini]
MTASADEVTVRRDGGVVTIELSAPQRLNAVSSVMLDQLRSNLAKADADPTVRVVVVTGAGKAFCSGAHLQLDVHRESDAPDTSTLASANQVVTTLTGMQTIVICGLNGPAAGVGVSIALACDLVLASEDAYFLLAFTRIGLMPDGGATAVVAASVGRSRALQLALLADRLSASEAERVGLVWSTHPPEELAGAVTQLADRIAAGPVAALGMTKRAVNAATLGGLDDALRREWDGQLVLLVGPEFAEGVDAFLGRRPADFAQ